MVPGPGYSKWGWSPTTQMYDGSPPQGLFRATAGQCGFSRWLKNRVYDRLRCFPAPWFSLCSPAGTAIKSNPFNRSAAPVWRELLVGWRSGSRWTFWDLFRGLHPVRQGKPGGNFCWWTTAHVAALMKGKAAGRSAVPGSSASAPGKTPGNFCWWTTAHVAALMKGKAAGRSAVPGVF